MTQEAKKNFLINCLFFVVLGAIVYFAFKTLIVYIFPFFIGLLVSMIVQKPATTLHRRLKLPKSVCMISLVIVVYILVMLVVFLAAYGIYNWLWRIGETIPQILPTLTEAAELLSARLSDFVDTIPGALKDTIMTLPTTAVGAAGEQITGLITSLATSLVSGIPSVILGVIITIIASAYIAKDYTKVVTFLGDQLPPRVWELALASKQILFKNIFRMLRGYALLMFITFCELCITFLILGYGKRALSIAAVIAVVDILPILGTGTVLIPWGIIELIFGNFLHGGVILIAYLIITILRNVLEPKIIGQQVGVHPLLMLFVLFIGLKLFGILGMFGMVLLVVICAELQHSGKIRIWVTREESKLRRKVHRDSKKQQQ